MTKLFLLLEGIDLGDGVIGVFSTQEKADEAKDKLNAQYLLKLGRVNTSLRVESAVLDEIDCQSWWWKECCVPS